MEDIRIRCPKCAWEPDGGAHWICDCEHIWNTFDTYGTCPACGKHWKQTACPDTVGGCGKWSLHPDWYEVPVDIAALMGSLPAEKPLS